MTVYRDRSAMRTAADRIAATLYSELRGGVIQKIGIEEIQRKVLLEEPPLRTDQCSVNDLEELTCRYVVEKSI